jgi:hypothetical protein
MRRKRPSPIDRKRSSERDDIAAPKQHVAGLARAAGSAQQRACRRAVRMRRRRGRSAFSQCVTGGRPETAAAVGGLRHVGWPKPLVLIPVPPFGFGLMSKMILSG